jgi:hypothetical protein
MARPKGSKNLPKDQDVEDTDQEVVESPDHEPVLLGYHPITDEEVWQ